MSKLRTFNALRKIAEDAKPGKIESTGAAVGKKADKIVTDIDEKTKKALALAEEYKKLGLDKLSEGKRRVLAWLGKYGAPMGVTGLGTALTASIIAPPGKKLLYGGIGLPVGMALGVGGSYLYDHLANKAEEKV